MNSYNKRYLEQVAKEKGFVRDNLEDTYSDSSKRIAEDLRGALRELKEVIAGKKQLYTLDNLINEQ